ncbi:MAG TPA: VCBS repeat-containing protein, partial [Chryseolinea sp.]|nr:VCBS repeat-containing protein [Chryseolinea sp.]
MKQLVLLFITGAVAFAGNAQTANRSSQTSSQPAEQAFPKPGEWPAFRRSNTLEAHSPLKGSITSPTVVWKQFVGALESLMVIESGGKKTVMLPADEDKPANPADTIAFRSFVPKAAVQDENLVDQTTFTYVDILPEYPGKEKLEFESAFTKPMSNGQWPPCVGRCLAMKNGEWVTVWETKEIKDLFHALPLVADYDGDGTMEIGILPFYQLKLLDIRTGRVKDSVRFNDNRSYGFAGIYDFNNDGKTELLVQADFSKHVDVIGYRNGKLSVLWTQNVEQDIAHPAKILRVAPDPTADVDGDGQREVVTTIYNDGGDGKWHVSFMDAMTGKKKYDFPDEYFGAPLDVDGDGVPEILTTVTSGGGTLAKVRVWSIKGGQAKILWEKDKVSWETWYPNLGNNVKTMATLSQRTILSQKRGKKVYVVLREELSPTQTRISVAHWDGGFKAATSVTGEYLDGLGLDATGRLLARSRHQFGRASTLSVTDGKVVKTRTRRIGLEPSPAAVAWPDGAAEPTIVVQSSIQEQITFHPPKGSEAVVKFNHIPGRAQGTWWPRTYGPVIADLAGDG